jgi:nucleotide-binding universal stress UspA family protein
VAHRVLEQSPVSVLIVPPGFGGEVGRGGVATDFSEGSDLAMARAGALCRSLRIAELAVLHAFRIPPGHHMISSWGDAIKRLTAVSEQLSAEQAARVLGAAGGVRARALCGEGDEAETVARMAGEEKLGLLVIATHSRTLAATALLGRTGERIAGRAECPVWAEKSPALVQGLLDAMRQRLA